MHLGKYVLVRPVARGGMAVVHEAWDPDLRRRVALKVLREDVPPAIARRFHREASITARLRHPNIVPIHEVGTVRDEHDRPVHFIAMDFIEGRTYEDLLRERAPLPRLLGLLETIARAVHYAHGEGVVHRDLKPANILVDAKGPWLADFGIAHDARGTTRITRATAVLGTPHYMAPEQAEGRPPDGRADVYALGAILYEALAGRVPFDGGTAGRIYARIVHEEPPPLPRTAHPDLRVLCGKAIEKDPRRRYATAADFAEELARFRRGEPIRARPRVVADWLRRRRRAFAAAAAILAGAAAIWIVRPAAREVRVVEPAKIVEPAGWRFVDEGRIALERGERHLYRRDTGPDELFRDLDEALWLLSQAPHIAVSHRLQSRAWELKGEYGRAILSAREAVRLDSDSGEARRQLARVELFDAWISRRRPEPVACDDPFVSAFYACLRGPTPRAREILATMKPDEETHWLKALLASGAERQNEIRLALEIRPKFALALLALDDAASLTGAIRLHPKLAAAWARRASAHRAAGRGDLALADANEALRLDPRLAAAYLIRALLLRDAGDRAGALRDVEQALRTPQAWLIRGAIRIETGDVEGGLRDLERAPDGPERTLNRAIALRLLRRFEDAEAELRRLPESADQRYQMGLLLRSRGDRPGAEAEFRRALEIAPPDWSRRGAAKERLRD